MLLVSFKEFGLWPNFHGSLQKHKCFWKVKCLQISTQLPSDLWLPCWRQIWRLTVLVSFDVRDLGICTHLGICTKRRGPAANFRDTGGRLWWVLWIPPLPTYPSSWPSFPLSPHSPFKRPLNLFWTWLVMVSRNKVGRRTVDIIMLLVTVILKHLVKSVLSSLATQPSWTFTKITNLYIECNWLTVLWWFEDSNAPANIHVTILPKNSLPSRLPHTLQRPCAGWWSLWASLTLNPSSSSGNA